ncbi:uncharacterized protein N7500_003485 [Penicillium coprophilum]|uniref:uncharacterized protein n=1 Tax=Penicillium coprophilum TaxID=36646 RepID=UPI00238AA2BF|nr:uncharacterized protein N7500_003485 [Penicillium coprophilum]KAJ5170702.1 hypothetical protein N7500_003485 [Penicillium coprophilum]
MSPSTKEKIQGSVLFPDPTYAKEVKDLLDDSSSESIDTVATKKRKRGDRSGAKYLTTSSAMETLSPGSIHSKTPKTSRNRLHKSLHKKGSRRGNSPTEYAMPHEILRSTPPTSTLREFAPKSSDQKVAKEATSTMPTPTNSFELGDLPPSEFIVPRDLEFGLGIFDCSSERENSCNPVSEYLLEQQNEMPTPYTPVLRAVSQYNERLRGQCGSGCETQMVRQMYDELGDISERIENIMRGISVMLEKNVMDDCEFNGFDDQFGDHSEEEFPGALKGGSKSPLGWSDGEDNALFVADERVYPGECGSGVYGDD